jgi:hypothetical protein
VALNEPCAATVTLPVASVTLGQLYDPTKFAASAVATVIWHEPLVDPNVNVPELEWIERNTCSTVEVGCVPTNVTPVIAKLAAPDAQLRTNVPGWGAYTAGLVSGMLWFVWTPPDAVSVAIPVVTEPVIPGEVVGIGLPLPLIVVPVPPVADVGEAGDTDAGVDGDGELGRLPPQAVARSVSDPASAIRMTLPGIPTPSRTADCSAGSPPAERRGAGGCRW